MYAKWDVQGQVWPSHNLRGLTRIFARRVEWLHDTRLLWEVCLDTVRARRRMNIIFPGTSHHQHHHQQDEICYHNAATISETHSMLSRNAIIFHADFTFNGPRVKSQIHSTLIDSFPSRKNESRKR